MILEILLNIGTWASLLKSSSLLWIAALGLGICWFQINDVHLLLFQSIVFQLLKCTDTSTMSAECYSDISEEYDHQYADWD